MTTVDEIVPPPGPDGPLPDPPPPEAASPRSRRRRRRAWLAGGTAVVVAVLVAVSFIPVDQYRLAPGTLYATAPLVTAEDDEAHPQDLGDISFTTVSIKSATVLDAVLAWPDEASVLVDKELIDGDREPSETRRQNLAMMADAKQVAEYVALQRLGYPVEIVGEGALVQEVDPEGPTSGAVAVDDTIVAVDGAPTTTATELVDAIRDHAPGTEVALTVEAPPADDGTAGPTRTEVVTLAARPDDPGVAYLGIGPATRRGRIQLPIEVDIDSGDVGGPSAGLAFTLALIDLLTPGSLTGDAKVAATGSIDLNGGVGPVGAVQQKAALASREGVDLFLVPPDELAEAQRWAPDLHVVAVSSIDEALAAIAEAGGDRELVAELAAGPPAGSH